MSISEVEFQANINKVKTAINNNENVIIGGSIGSGKTTLLNESLEAVIKENIYNKKLIIEEDRELLFKNNIHENVIVTKISVDDLINISDPENTYIVMDEFHTIEKFKIFLLGSSLGLKFILSSPVMSQYDIVSRMKTAINESFESINDKKVLNINLNIIENKLEGLRGYKFIAVKRLYIYN